MSLPQKASLTSGSGMWHTQGIRTAEGSDDLVPRLLLTDGPHGLRKQVEGSDPLALDNGIRATCFPPAVTLGSTWNPALVERVGAAIGREARAEQVAVVLGPGVNIKRSLLCGRNFEYLSEDPVLAGRIGAALVRGIQSIGVGASLKHFAANNQETDRLRVSADIDERTLREIYLAAFEHVVTHAAPWTVMCAYNRVNGTYASEHNELLTRILRQEWGFDGLVMSDWGAVDDRVRALTAGLDLEMPPTHTDAAVVDAVLAGTLDEEVVDRAAGRLLALVDRTRAESRHPTSTPVDLDAHHQLARAAAADGAVLLKNDDGLLPLSPTAPQTIALIGPFAAVPRYQGSGSSRVTPTRVDGPLDAIRALVGAAVIVETVPDDGADTDTDTDTDTVALAARADVTVLFLGLPDEAESEGFDRTDIVLPADQLRLLDRVAAVTDRLVVVLANGGVVSVAEWQDRASAVLELWLPGQAGGLAVADLLFGRTNPSGRLTETIPLRLEDSPAYLHFPGAEGTVTYGEGLYVGYRYYDTLDVPVAYPFGHGLSYTTFEHTDLEVHLDRTTALVAVTVTNTGPVAGAEVVQVYVRAHGTVGRPRHVLGGFAKLSLEPGAGERVTIPLDARSFAYWSAREHRWRVEAGEAVIEVGASSRDLRLTTTITVPVDGHPPVLTPLSTVGEALEHPEAGPLLARPGGPIATMLADDTVDPGHHAMLRSVPLSRVAAFDPAIDVERLRALLAPPTEPRIG